MKCKLCEDKLLEYLYGELDREDAVTMERHLEASEPCRQSYKGFASLLDKAGGIVEQEPPPSLHTRIMGHAKEARVGRRSFWAWMLRPAVTTAVIGAITAGVYFTTLRHKPPSHHGERVLLEESYLGKAKQRNAPSPSEEAAPPTTPSPMDEDRLSTFARKKAEGASAGIAKTKEDKDQALWVRLAEPPGAIERGEGERQAQMALEKPEPLRLTRPDAEQVKSATAADSRETEQALAPVRKKAEVGPAEGDHALAERMGWKAPATSGTRALPMTLGASAGRDLASVHTEVPPTIAQAVDLASEGHCSEAEERVQAFSSEHPEEDACGAGWLETARCYARKGDTKDAREMAEKALRIHAYEPEARSFLESIPPAAE